jgi:WD40 repeat protein
MSNVCVCSGAVTQVEFAPDGETLFSGSTDGTTRCWDVHSGKAKEDEDAARVLAGGKFAFAKGSSREQKVGEFLVTAEGDMLRIFKSAVKDKDSAPVAFFRAPGTISTIDTSGAHIAVGCANGEVLALRAAVLLTA